MRAKANVIHGFHGVFRAVRQHFLIPGCHYSERNAPLANFAPPINPTKLVRSKLVYKSADSAIR